ncbi:MAG TPA: Rrf2 family transcriptional regulator [Acidimicrobiia bacterium]|nr:Rrf2 family transcriptional regulator [Acidimicrobiia bacterium]
MRISAKADYAVRAMAELAAAPADHPIKAEALAASQDIPRNFLDNILSELRASGLVRTLRGPEGGSMLGRPASEITVAEVLRAVEGPLAAVRGTRPEALEYPGAATRLPEVWVALRANLRAVLETVTLADLAASKLPAAIARLAKDPDAWQPH